MAAPSFEAMITLKQMVRFTIPQARLIPCLLALAICICALNAQKGQRVVPAPVDPKPFSAIAARSAPIYTVGFRSADEISQQDRLLIANAESSIAEHAGFAGLEYQGSAWTSRQVVCPSFPNHLFLQYTRNNGSGDVSVFSASIPRNGEGRVRIVPILRRSYSLFSPAPINSLTISAFNHIRAEEGQSANADWLGNALCYAALAGSQPEIVKPGATPELGKPVAALSAQLEIQTQDHREEVIRFDDAAGHPHATEWTMTFARNGRLIKATHRSATLRSVRPVSNRPAVARSWPAPQSPQD